MHQVFALAANKEREPEEELCAGFRPSLATQHN